MSELALPEGWLSIDFMDVLDVQGGTQPPKSTFIYEESEGYIRLLQIRDFGDKPVPTYVPDTKKLRTCEEDDVLIARYGASLGRICTGMKGAYNVALAKVVVPEHIKKDYLKYFLKSGHFQDPLNLLSRSAQNGFNKKDLESFPLVVPSQPEQEAIVKYLDNYLTTVSQIQARLDAIPKLIEKFRQSVLNDAVSGKLTEEWRIANNMEFDWQEKKLGSIAKEIKYGLTASSTNKDTGIKFVRITDLHKNNINWDSVPYCEATTEEVEKYKLNKGDLLFARTGATVGKSYLLKKDPKNAVFASYLIKVSMSEEHNEEYLELFFQSLNYWSQISTLKSGIGQPSVNGTKLKGLLIPLPKVAEQNEIVFQAKKLLEVSDNIEKSIATAKARVDNLTQSILHQAFTGQLTKEWREQNPDLISGDNSAEALLVKIKAEKKAPKTKKKK